MITGISGFLGKNLSEYLAEKDENIKLLIPYNDLKCYENKGLEKLPNTILVPCDINNLQSLKEIFNFYDIGTIIHLAAKSSSRNGSYDVLENNLKTTFNLLESCKPGTRFIFSSTILVYNTTFNGGYCESDRLSPSTMYALSKTSCEHLINIYKIQGKVRPVILRLCGLVGKYMSHGRLYEAMKGKTEFNLFGKAPGNYIPYLHVKDACKAIYNSLKYTKYQLTANICPNDNISLEDSLKLINPNVSLTWDNSSLPSEFIQCYNEKADYELDWIPTFTTAEAIKEMINGNAE